MKTSDFDYVLPQELIAQTPLEPRDRSRLMVVNRASGSLEHRCFNEILDYLGQGDVLVFNDSRVIPARIYSRKADNRAKMELLLLRRLEPNVWEALVKPARRARVGSRLEFDDDAVEAVVVALGEGGKRVIRFSDETALLELGTMPLPPYIRTPLKDAERYQTVYASDAGSVAAPTAGLHFTRELLKEINDRGVECLFVTLHVGLDTFLPVRTENPHEHQIHREYGVVSPEVAARLLQAKEEGRRVICVGTTALRLVEAAAQKAAPVGMAPFDGWVSLFILPGYRFKMADSLVTNFHLPKSTLLMLISAFAGSDLVKKAYREAINLKYRFYSFGDAMLIL